MNIVLGLGLTIGLFLLLQKTKLGLAIRTTASSEKTARLMGVPTKWVTLFGVGISACFRYVVRCNDCAINICYG